MEDAVADLCWLGLAKQITNSAEAAAAVKAAEISEQDQERIGMMRHTDSGKGALRAGTGTKQTCFLRHFRLKRIFLPRQARDKHRKSRGENTFLQAIAAIPPRHAVSSGKRVFLRHFILQMIF